MTCAKFFICREQMHASEANHHTDERIKPPPDESPRWNATEPTAIGTAAKSDELTSGPDSNDLTPLDHSPTESRRVPAARLPVSVETTGGVP
jgi:hypothetical protein